jgi:MoaA/NifB/PqqE/SkfB family radical SAM enzyme
MIYSSLKAAWHTESIERMRKDQPVIPRQVQIILSDLCNHDCGWCAYRSSVGFSSGGFGEDTGRGFTMNPNRKIPTEKAAEILMDMVSVGVPAVQFTGGGEPTVHPDHLDLFTYAQDLGLKTSMVSNGSQLKKGWEMVLPRMEWIRISLDAGSPGTYAKVRRVNENQFDKTLKHIEMLAEEIKRQETQCVLGVSYIVTNENWKELILAAMYAKEAGARYIRYGACYTTQGMDYYEKRDMIPAIHRSIELAQRNYADEGFDVIDMFVTRAEDLEAKAPDFKRCGYQQLNAYVAGNLKVYRCCTTSYTPHGEIGDLNARTFKEWLLDPETTKKYVEFDARTCQSCPFSEKNRVINYMLDPAPTHVEFV